MKDLTIAIVRAWTWLYTVPARPALRDRRREEIESDLYEFQRDIQLADGPGLAIHMLLRLVIGLPDDLAWCLEHVADADGTVAPGRTIALTARAVGGVLFVAAMITIAGDAGRRRSGFVFDRPEAPHVEGRQTLLLAGIAATVAPTMTPADSFDVASIKPNRSGAPRLRMVAEPGGRFTAVNVSLLMLVRYAYQRSDFEISGGPGWMDSDRFDVVAKAATDAPQEQIRLMLRSLLADRFGLHTRTETRELPIYALMMARNDGRFGPQFRRTEADCRNAPPFSPGQAFPDPPPACGFFGPVRNLGKLGFRGLTMASVTGLLKPIVRRVVVDRTGLDGYFDGDFDFTTELGPPPPPPGLPDRFDRQSFATVFTVLPEQLGLRLDSQRGAVEVLVIEDASQPTPD